MSEKGTGVSFCRRGVTPNEAAEGVHKMNLQSVQKIIVLQGNPNTGKTSILNEVCRQLQRSPLVSNFNPADVEPSRTQNGDQRFFITHTQNAVNKKIAVITAGDDANCIMKGFLYAEKKAATILVMALSNHSRGYKTAERLFDEIESAYQLNSMIDRSQRTQVVPNAPVGYVDQAIVRAICNKI